MKIHKIITGLIAGIGLLILSGLPTQSIHASMPSLTSNYGMQYWSYPRHVRARYGFKIYRTHDTIPEADLYNIGSRYIPKNTPLYVRYRGIAWAWTISGKGLHNHYPYYWTAGGYQNKFKPYYDTHAYYVRRYTSKAKDISQTLNSDQSKLNKYQNTYSFNKLNSINTHLNQSCNNLKKLVRLQGNLSYSVTSRLRLLINKSNEMKKYNLQILKRRKHHDEVAENVDSFYNKINKEIDRDKYKASDFYSNYQQNKHLASLSDNDPKKVNFEQSVDYDITPFSAYEYDLNEYHRYKNNISKLNDIKGKISSIKNKIKN